MMSSLECWWCDKLLIQIKVHRENSVTLSLYPTQISTVTDPGSNSELRNEKYRAKEFKSSLLTANKYCVSLKLKLRVGKKEES
jgi:hypothetical protein